MEINKLKLRNGAATDSLMLTFVRLVTACISILIYKMLAVNFSLDEYGVYSQVTLVSTTFISITIMGMTDAINFFYNKDKGGKIGRSYVETIFALQIIVGTVSAIIIIAFRNQIAASFDEPKVAGLLVYIAFIPLLTNLCNMLQVLFISYRRAKMIAVRNLLFSLFKVFAVFLASYYFKSIKVVLINSLVLDVILVSYMVWYSRKYFFSINIHKANFALVKEILIYCVPMAMYIVTNSLSRNLDKLVVGWFGTTEDIALYSIAAKELPFDMFTSSFITVLVPYITRYIAGAEYDKASETFSKYLQISYIITWIVAGGAIVGAEDLMVILYDQKYVSAITIFILYIIVDMLRFSNASIVFAAQNRTKELLIYSGGALLANLVLNISFFMAWGIVGPAISTVVISMLLSVIMVYRSGRLLSTKITKLVNLKQMIVILVEIIVCGAVIRQIQVRFMDGLSTFTSFCLSFGLYALPLFLLNFKRILVLLREINSLKMIIR